MLFGGGTCACLSPPPSTHLYDVGLVGQLAHVHGLLAGECRGGAGQGAQVRYDVRRQKQSRFARVDGGPPCNVQRRAPTSKAVGALDVATALAPTAQVRCSPSASVQ